MILTGRQVAEIERQQPRHLLEQAKPVNVDYISNAMGQGFIIASGMTRDVDCSGCTGC